jgi:hypothetical protein
MEDKQAENATKGGAAMKKIVIVPLAVAALVLIPLAGYPQTDQKTSELAPPVAQPLVPEGSFAMSLAKSLGIGAPQNEADAESLLASVGIAPKNGWISDYPVTPDVLGDLQEAVAAASDSGSLPIGKDEALKSLQAVADEFGLPVVAPGSGIYTQNNGPPTPYNEENPAIVNDYYYTYGPPVVTYYPPPPDYEYLYVWVPYPFWFEGFFFTGYFCLHDFDKIIVVNHASRISTNHVFDRRTGTTGLIDPAERSGESKLSYGSGYASPEARKTAGAIFNRSFERGKARVAKPGHVSRGLISASPGPFRPGEHFQSQVALERHYGTQAMRTGTFRPPQTQERAPSMRFPSGGASNFSRDASFGGSRGRDFSHRRSQ